MTQLSHQAEEMIGFEAESFTIAGVFAGSSIRNTKASNRP